MKIFLLYPMFIILFLSAIIGKKNYSQDEYTFLHEGKYFYSLLNEDFISLSISNDETYLTYNNIKVKGNVIYYNEHDYYTFVAKDESFLFDIPFEKHGKGVSFDPCNNIIIKSKEGVDLVPINDSTNRNIIFNHWLVEKNDKYELSPINARILNDKAFYLCQANYYNEAIMILNVVVKYQPNRTVAYINLGDAYWGLNETNNAKEAYQKYIELMKANGKESKIPQRILDRVK